MNFKEKLIERFLKYVSFETTSDEFSETCPSTKLQLNLAKYLVDEMKEMGIESQMDENGYVYGKIPATNKTLKKVGFIAHMDTSPDFTGKNVKAQRFVYEGGDIKLNENLFMGPKEFPFLKNIIGKEIITSDGTTLLGADDKAGIAIIMTMAELILNSNEKHGQISLAFTPDEEIGRGADKFDIKKFDADFAYTVDGGPIGELEYETFNAASGILTVYGKNVHPGSAKDIMVNSAEIACEFDNILPRDQIPQNTENYDGFFHLLSLEGNTEKTVARYIIRDHSREKFENKKELFKNIGKLLSEKYKTKIETDVKDSYYNMKEKLETHMDVIELAKKSMEDINIKPLIQPIRGGTDGSKLSFMGLPTPNLFTGGYNFHGKYEFVVIESMEKCVNLLLKIIENIGE